jgi:outer membrane protein
MEQLPLDLMNLVPSFFRRRVAWCFAAGLLNILVPAYMAGATPPPDVPDRLDLPTAIRFALDNNYAIRQARERLREQEGLIMEVRGTVLPNVGLSSTYSLTDKELSADQQGGGAAPNDDQQYWSFTLQARQLLYSGGGARAAISAQRLVREAALLELQQIVNDQLLQVRTKFYEVLLLREQIDVQVQNVQLLEQQLQTARNRFEAGAVSNFDVLRAEVELANAQPPLIRARNGFRVAVEELRLLLGYDNRSDHNLQRVPEFVGDLNITPISYEIASALRTAREARPELQRLARVEEARQAGVEIARSGYRPDLALVAGYQLRKHNFSDRFRESLDGWSVGLQSNWAIWDGRSTTGRVIQARSQLEQSRLQLAEATLGVDVEVRRALSSLQEAAELAGAAGRVVEQAEEALRLADARYRAGTATQLDVLTARVALTQARDNQLQANYSHNVAVAALRRALGQSDALVTAER